ncbi:hypothetical protein FCI23_46720 [Actinacidiphila oryziradicis]|uniref:AMP-dependent synthetase/ligase domain-containing protein n=1 Tax=Actinacidiphila oryziradicis TaxID=2571141 RepID=A0A4U0RSX8_9ACTN|nr:hypothetical protein FCI23_46720 [Actinacidiphila oryziradicis]
MRVPRLHLRLDRKTRGDPRQPPRPGQRCRALRRRTRRRYCGGRVVVAPDAARTDGTVLRDLVERHDVRTVQATPTTWRAVLDRVGPALDSTAERSSAATNPYPSGWPSNSSRPAAKPHHAYGPTETTIWSTSAVLSGPLGARLDIGRPIRNSVRPAVQELRPRLQRPADRRRERQGQRCPKAEARAGLRQGSRPSGWQLRRATCSSSPAPGA